MIIFYGDPARATAAIGFVMLVPAHLVTVGLRAVTL